MIDVLHVVWIRLSTVVVDKMFARNIHANIISEKKTVFSENSHSDCRKMTAYTVIMVRSVIAAKISAISFHTR